ncbi:MAG: flagellin, partial [Defluviitaleaceae bacterium]|nr:flagellin [Defluviitaleaceae bacterium]
MSNMVVRTNVFALNSHRNLTNVGHMQRNAAQRLSSGFRVNSAADDAAGLAISETMRAQIRGLDQASINTQDGVGLIQTAEGAMATISDMIIRVRELMVQAANDTNTYNNREMIQEEIDQIMTEINQVTFRTQFNTRTLLAGGLGGEGGGVSSPVSLQWMVFDQARVIGLPQSGGIVTRVLPPNSR